MVARTNHHATQHGALPRILLILIFQIALMAAFVVFSLPNQRALCSPQPGDSYFRAVGGTLVDGACHQVRLTGINWFGMETDAFAPHGLQVRNWQDMLDQIARAGFNTIRFPFSNQFFDPNSVPKGIDYQKNPDLKGLRGLALLDRFIQGAGLRGLRVILDRHRPTAQGQSELWYTDQVPESRWIADWTMLARHYRDNPTVIGADLHNEPHGPATWGSGDPKTDWRLAAERAGNAILAANPDWLIIVQGIEQYQGDWYWWGGNLEGAARFPVWLTHPDKLVYSIHDYGPEVYPQSWFWDPSFPRNLPAIWLRHWAYLPLEGQAPVLVGEFGARSVGPGTEGTWLSSLVDFMQANGISYTYWAWNPDSGDTGGLLKDDWKTLDEAKLHQLDIYQAPPLALPLVSSLGRIPGDQRVAPSQYEGGLPWADVPAPLAPGKQHISRA